MIAAFLNRICNGLDKMFSLLRSALNEDSEIDNLTKEDWRLISDTVDELKRTRSQRTEVKLSVGIREISIL